LSGLSGGVTILSGFTAPDDQQTITTYSGDVALSTSPTTIRTVTVGQTWYVNKIYLNGIGANTVFIFADNGVEILRVAVTLETVGGQTQRDFTLPSPVAFGTNCTCKLGGGSGTALIFMSGWEQ